MKSKLLFIFIPLIVCSILNAQSPGNVPLGLELWLKADSGVVLTGTNVNSWTDQSVTPILGTSDGINDATYIADGLNFNPVIQFSGDEFYNFGTPVTLNIDPSLLGMTIISVINTNQAQGGTVLSKGDDIDRNFQLRFDVTNRVAHNIFGRSIANNAERVGTFYTRDEPKLNSSIVNLAVVDPLLRLTPFINGLPDVSTTNDGVQSGTSNLSDVLIGARRQTINTGSTDFYHGDIAEVIVYSRDITVLELQQVESYLAIKYGIVLGANDQTWDPVSATASNWAYSGTSSNYFNSLGTIVWNGPSNAGYGHNIIGIARDDNASLLQTKSTSSSILTESILTIEGEIGSLLNDDAFLMIGSNGQDTNLSTTGIPARTASAMNRMWKVNEVSNETGLMQLEFDLSGTTITDAEAANLDLYVADDASLDNYKNYGGVFNTGTKILTYNLINLDDGQFFTLASPDVLAGAFAIEFDGVDDFIETNLDLSGLPEATIMCWVKRNNDTELFQTGIIGQPGVLGLSVLGDDLSVLYGGNIVGGLDLTQAGIGNNGNEWHHIATSFKNGDVKMYFDGELVGSVLDAVGNSVLGIATAATFSIGGNVNSILGTDNFEGQIDEVRVFNIALEDEHIQQVVYQEIQDVLGNVRGSVIPKDIEDDGTSSNVNWSALSLYYTMNIVRGNCVVDGSSNLVNGALNGIVSNTLWDQTAPMPYLTTANGDWTTEATWLHGDVWDIENLPNKDWAIVEIKNEIDTNASHSHLGLIVDAGAKLNINGTNELKNTWYLDLNGTIDLKEDSQLVQIERSDLTVTSAGKIVRRQEGTSNLYRYNYWGSPVGATSIIANNTNYSLNLLKDGTNNILFTTVYNPPLTTPATLSTRWLYTFQNGVTYWDWMEETESSTIPAGVGYIHKGPGSVGTDYQYVFEGKPNNGLITIPVLDTGGPGSVESVSKTQFLLGNPYASALDAHKFIEDNPVVSSGTLYLWEQWNGNSHILNEYEGGYATLNMTSKVRAYQFVGINGANNGSQDGTKTPTQFLPVGQGFMTEIEQDGDIMFNNTQRIFKEEALGETVFFRFANHYSEEEEEVNEEGEVAMGLIRLEFTTSNSLSRELVLGFSTNTTDSYDYGYDSRVNTFKTNDLATVLGEDKMVIQAFSPITDDKEIDLILNSDGNYSYSINLLELENITASQEIYLHDTQESIYHNLRESAYDFVSDEGEDSSRFKIIFKNENAIADEELETSNVLVYTNNIERKLYIKGLKDDVQKLSVINILGQQITKYDNIKKDTIDAGVSLPEVAPGIYIVDFELQNGKHISKKISIN